MQLWPAIDLIDGKCVRLYKGDYAQKTEYQYSLEDLAKEFSNFAHGIHIVDLDGAKAGKPINEEAIKTIIQNSTIQTEVGGGIRTEKDIETVLSWGVDRVILGTKALTNPEFVVHAIQQFGKEKIVIGVDAKNGNVAISGWEETSHISAEKFIQELEQIGVKTIIYTDIDTDGTLLGPPIKTFAHLTKTFPNSNIIASGGIANNEDIKTLQSTGVQGCIFGKAWYEGKLSFTEERQ